jgi:hypothetical protein
MVPCVCLWITTTLCVIWFMQQIWKLLRRYKEEKQKPNRAGSVVHFISQMTHHSLPLFSTNSKCLWHQIISMCVLIIPCFLAFFRIFSILRTPYTSGSTFNTQVTHQSLPLLSYCLEQFSLFVISTVSRKFYFSFLFSSVVYFRFARS